jgi:PAS domain S-box-containing protein
LGSVNERGLFYNDCRGDWGVRTVPFDASFQTHTIVERVQRVRRNPIAAYGSAVILVTLAALGRWAVGEYVGLRVPFITFYPAIIVATLLGGLWPGIIATFLSSLAAWYLFLGPGYSWTLEERELIQLLLFVVICGINLTVVALLNALVDRILAQREGMRILLESAPNGVVVVDERGVIKLVNASAEKLFGYTRSELLGQAVEVLVPDRQVAAHRGMREAFLQSPDTRPMGSGRDLCGRRKDGSEFAVEVGLNPVSQNGTNAVLATVIDITERKQAQDRQKFLIKELRHRSLNLFAVIQAIAERSLVEGHTLTEAKQLFSGRLAALARAHAMLADATWEGAPLAEILKKEFAGFSKHFDFRGFDIIVNSPAAQQFALIVHELATNAIKHGALSAPSGRVSIEGRVDRLNGKPIFLFLWKESGGPPVSAPTRKGFGSTILLDAAKQLGKYVALNFEPQGVTYELRVPLSEIQASKNPASHESTALSSTRTGSI